MNIRIILLATAAIAAPQAAFAEPAAKPGGSQQLEEIVVTAQRRSERLQDVPMSITALSADKLEKSGIANTADLSRVTPGLVMASYSNNLQPSIRGVTATGGNTGDNPSVAMYLDGVYQAQQVALLMDLPDTEQVEVLKGPQGALYGQNATGGAIIIRTMEPAFSPTGKLSASYGNYDAVDLRGFVTGPIVGDTVALSVAGSYQNHDGFRRHVVTGEREKGLDSKLVRAKLLVKPSDKAKFVVTGYYGDRNDSSIYAATAVNGNSSGYAVFPNAPRVTSSKQYGTNPGVFSRVRAKGVSAQGELQSDLGTLNLVAAYAQTKVTAMNDLDASPVDLIEYHWEALRTKTKVAEATFASREFGPISFLAGALYLDGRDCFCQGRFVQRTPTLPPTPTSAPAFEVLGRGVIDRKIWSVYGELNFKPTDALTLTAGGRYSHETQRGFQGTNVGIDPPIPALQPYPKNPAKWSKFSPRFTARYEIAPSQNVYASYTQGFKGGLINTSNLNQDALDPETIKAYEVGYKGRLASNLSVELAAFLYDYKNLQVVSYLSGDEYITQNAATARGKGVEASADWAVTPDLTVSAGVAYLNAKYRDYKNAQGFMATGFGNVAILIPDRGGDRLIRSPEWSGTLAADYRKEIAQGVIGANASLYFTDDYTVDPLGINHQDGYTTLNAEVSFSPASLPGLRLVAWGKNIGDKAYISGGQVNNFSTQISWADPRTYGVRAEYKF